MSYTKFWANYVRPKSHPRGALRRALRLGAIQLLIGDPRRDPGIPVFYSLRIGGYSPSHPADGLKRLKQNRARIRPQTWSKYAAIAPTRPQRLHGSNFLRCHQPQIQSRIEPNDGKTGQQHNCHKSHRGRIQIQEPESRRSEGSYTSPAKWDGFPPPSILWLCSTKPSVRIRCRYGRRTSTGRMRTAKSSEQQDCRHAYLV